jgi:hypothetical protein
MRFSRAHGNQRTCARIATCTAAVSMRGLAFALLLAAGCQYYTGGDDDRPGDVERADGGASDDGLVHYRLVESGQIAGAGQISGVTFDGEHVWLAYYREVGDYDDNDVVSIVELDADGAELVRYEYDDDYTPPNGIAWVDGALWINYNAVGGTGSQVMREIDPATGAVRRQIATEQGTWDLEFDGSHILLSNLWNQVQLVDPVDGSLDRRIETPMIESSTQRGVAWRPGEIWLASQASDRMVILDSNGVEIASARTDVLDPGWNYVFDLYVAFVGDRLALVVSSRVYLFDVVPDQSSMAPRRMTRSVPSSATATTVDGVPSHVPPSR